MNKEINDYVEKIKDYIETNKISLFDSKIIPLKSKIFKTKDSQKVFQSVISNLKGLCTTKAGSGIFNLFFNEKDIKKKQDFFKSIENQPDNLFLKKLRKPSISWRPDYSIIIATEDEEVYLELRKDKIPSVLLENPAEIEELKGYDLIQYHSCDRFFSLLEEIPSSIEIKEKNDLYLERYLIELSQWKENIEILLEDIIPESIPSFIPIIQLMSFIERKEKVIITKEKVEDACRMINENLSNKIKEITLSGEIFIELLKSKKLPEEFKTMIYQEIKSLSLPLDIFIDSIPVEIDQEALEEFIKEQESSDYISFCKQLNHRKEDIKMIPYLLRELEKEIIILDFKSAIKKYKDKIKDFTIEFPKESSELRLLECRNLLLKDAKPISFMLNDIYKCSILTGANSGGKTTLLEHIMQAYILMQLGLPICGKFSSPRFEEIYYFAKNKGSMNRGAFENLLIQMSGVNQDKKTLILADEIEAVTEPSAAGKIISATAGYFIKNNSFSIFATHLGNELVKNLPDGARIDGIEAKGLDENNEVIIDHNPIMGRLANSTPELIIERLARVNKHAYFDSLYETILNDKAKEHNIIEKPISLTP